MVFEKFTIAYLFQIARERSCDYLLDYFWLAAILFLRIVLGLCGYCYFSSLFFELFSYCPFLRVDSLGVKKHAGYQARLAPAVQANEPTLKSGPGRRRKSSLAGYMYV